MSAASGIAISNGRFSLYYLLSLQNLITAEAPRAICFYTKFDLFCAAAKFSICVGNASGSGRIFRGCRGQDTEEDGAVWFVVGGEEMIWYRQQGGGSFSSLLGAGGTARVNFRKGLHLHLSTSGHQHPYLISKTDFTTMRVGDIIYIFN